ncbi:MAG: hypothetical protein V1787_05710 [Candidatus Micrarchaeota archaeon]
MKRALLIALALCAAAAAQTNFTGYLTANVSMLAEQADVMEITSLSYPPQGVVRGRAFQIAGLCSEEGPAIGCSGPSACACTAVKNEFSCSFSPPVGGVYSLEFSSAAASATYYLELHEGRQVRLTSVMEEEPPSNKIVFYGMALLGICFMAYLAYYAYRFLTRKRRNVKRLLQRKIEIEHDMEALRFRYMKREIDEITLAQLMQQKKLELIQVSYQISEAEGRTIL